MAVSDRSIMFLNSKLSLEDQVHHSQFRDNLLIDVKENIKPHDEDEWNMMKIGKDEASTVILKYNSFCYRCILPNIDVNNFERNKNFEPLATLNK